MIPYNYGFGFEPNGYPPVDLQIDFKQLGRDCKAIAKRVSRKIQRKMK